MSSTHSATVSSTSHAEPTTASWQSEMKQAIRTAADLVHRCHLPAEMESKLDFDPNFPVFAPEPLLRRIKPADINDPILLQVLPLNAENLQHPDFVNDPLQETTTYADSAIKQRANLHQANQQQSAPVLKKYRSRALLITTGACGIHCRYCFRRHFPYQQLPNDRKNWDSWLEPIRQDSDIFEVILSGGDPLVLTDPSLSALINGLRSIPHVRWLRLHSRMPVVIPTRVTPQLLETLQGFQNCTMVLHINHANEIDESVRQAVAALKQNNIEVLNQSVLLKDVNDNLSALKNLSITLVEAGIRPYYLHLLDRVQGAAHFLVPDVRAKSLMQQLRSQLPGHAVPQLAREIPGQPYKSLIDYA